MTATHLIAARQEVKRYPSATYMARSFGLTLHEHSSGRKQKLLEISQSVWR
ncbi:transposase [Paraburkholderia sp. 32]|uniref:transposase n=1 Tax=Paraburkholderia sp. 32 TaxID=2991057 RepID=UPI003D23DC16